MSAAIAHTPARAAPPLRDTTPLGDNEVSPIDVCENRMRQFYAHIDIMASNVQAAKEVLMDLSDVMRAARMKSSGKVIDSARLSDLDSKHTKCVESARQMVNASHDFVHVLGNLKIAVDLAFSGNGTISACAATPISNSTASDDDRDKENSFANDSFRGLHPASSDAGSDNTPKMSASSPAYDLSLSSDDNNRSLTSVSDISPIAKRDFSGSEGNSVSTPDYMECSPQPATIDVKGRSNAVATPSTVFVDKRVAALGGARAAALVVDLSPTPVTPTFPSPPITVRPYGADGPINYANDDSTLSSDTSMASVGDTHNRSVFGVRKAASPPKTPLIRMPKNGILDESSESAADVNSADNTPQMDNSPTVLIKMIPSTNSFTPGANGRFDPSSVCLDTPSPVSVQSYAGRGDEIAVKPHIMAILDEMDDMAAAAANGVARAAIPAPAQNNSTVHEAEPALSVPVKAKRLDYSVFPATFQTGRGASELGSLFAVFLRKHEEGRGKKAVPMTFMEICDALGGASCDRERTSILLKMLKTRGYVAKVGGRSGDTKAYALAL